MKTLRIGLNHLPVLDKPLALAVGYFDGFHLGHQALVEEAKKKANEHGYFSAVLSFHPNPLVTLGKMKEEKYLSSLEDREKILKKMGIDYFLILDFSKEVANLPPEDFVQIFMKGMQVKEVICGFDFYFGRQGKGDGNFLKQYASDFHVSIIDQVALDHLKVSSTRIVQALQEGKIEEANRLLTRPYHVSGIVVQGKQRGRLMGFPTANIDYGAYYLPHFGVYGVVIEVAGKKKYGMCNIGVNPTFKDIAHPSMEINIFDFDEDIYGMKAEVDFYCYTRKDQKFASMNELMMQLKSDKRDLMKYFAEHPKF